MKSISGVVYSVALTVVIACGGNVDRDANQTPVVHTSVETPIPLPDVEPEAPRVRPVEIPDAGSAATPVELPKSYDDALALGKRLVESGDHGRAREVLIHAAKLDKKQFEPHVELARSYIATSERANAIKSAAKAVKLAPESSQAYNTLGRAELLRHNYDAAVIAFRQATELNPDNVWAWNNLGFTYLTLKDYDEAVNALVEATSRKGTTAYMWNNLGTAYEQLDQLDDARDAYEHGGKLGSVAAAASRKRLEGVDTIMIVKADVTDKLTDKVTDKPIDSKADTKPGGGVDYAEPMPEAPVDPELPPDDEAKPVDKADNDVEDVKDVKIEESGVDTKAEQPTVIL